VHVLDNILSKLEVSRCPQPLPLQHQIRFRYPKLGSATTDLSQSTLLEKFQDFIKPNDVLVCETGSFMFGIPDLRFTKNMRYISQGFYLSIGAALPMSVGVGIAMRDENSASRLILIEGDGSAQMTFQEFSSFSHYGLKPIIFLLNNSGYTVERIIKGETRSYNDIKPWNWTKTFEVFEFGDARKNTISKKISNEGELDKSLSVLDGSKLNFFEVILDPMDCPWRFHHMNGYRHFPLIRED
jgi:phenylpyruvate decarboxylase